MLLQKNRTAMSVNQRKKFYRGAQELKFVDRQKTFTASNSVILYGASTDTVLPSQGAGDSERIGRTISCKSLHIRGQCVIPATNDFAEGSTILRLVVGVDTQCNGSDITVADVFDAGVETALITNRFRQLDNVYRIKILYDKVISVNSQAAQGNGTTRSSYQTKRNWYANIPLGFKTHFSGTTTNTSNVADNNIFVLLLDSEGVCTGEFNARLRYTDN